MQGLLTKRKSVQIDTFASLKQLLFVYKKGLHILLHGLRFEKLTGQHSLKAVD